MIFFFSVHAETLIVMPDDNVVSNHFIFERLGGNRIH